MESIDLDLDDIFDREAIGDNEDVGAQAPLPDLDDDEGPMREDGETQNDEDDGGVVANLQRLSKGAAKKRVMRPQPKLDADRLKGERGLAVLPKLFENVRFKGKGHEGEDIKLMMGKLEHWAHRLFPKMPFDDFIERMEKLGVKKPVQNCVKRIRLGMPVLDDDYVAQYDNIDAPPAEDEPPIDLDQQGEADVDAEDAFEEMIRQEKIAQQRRKEEEKNGDGAQDSDDNQPGPSSGPQLSQGIGESPLRDSTPQASRKHPTTPEKLPDSGSGNISPAAKTTPSQKKAMTPDVKAKIEENKRRALERRAARLGVPVHSLMSPKPVQTPDAPPVLLSPDAPAHSLPKLPSPSPVKSKPQNTISHTTATQNGETHNHLPPDSQNVAGTHLGAASQKAAADSKLKDVMQTEDEILNTLELSVSDDDSETRLNNSISVPKENIAPSPSHSIEMMDIADNKECNNISPLKPSKGNHLLVEKEKAETEQTSETPIIESMDSEILPIYN